MRCLKIVKELKKIYVVIMTETGRSMDLGRNTLLNFQEVLGWFEMGLKWTI